MHLTFDARMYGLEHAGIGRYIQNLTHALLAQYPGDHYRFLVHPHHVNDFAPHPHLTLTPALIRHYTFKEQILLPRLLNSPATDLVHFPHFNVPLTYNRPFVVTIHDILWHQVKGPRVTTLSPVKYALKYQAYLKVVRHALFASKKIIAPSRWVKHQLTHTFPRLQSDKIEVIYEAVDPQLFSLKPQEPPIQLKKPFLVYTGSAYPHKNLKRLIYSLVEINRHQPKPIHLYLISARNIFLDQIKLFVKQKQAGSFVFTAGALPDNQLKYVYQQATALVHPSLSEGFGLTGLEAMALGLPVISSNAGSLPEIYSDAALYFNPLQLKTITRTISQFLSDPSLARQLRQKGSSQAAKYTWEKAARQTHDIYQDILASS